MTSCLCSFLRVLGLCLLGSSPARAGVALGTTWAFSPGQSIHAHYGAPFLAPTVDLRSKPGELRLHPFGLLVGTMEVLRPGRSQPQHLALGLDLIANAVQVPVNRRLELVFRPGLDFEGIGATGLNVHGVLRTGVELRSASKPNGGLAVTLAPSAGLFLHNFKLTDGAAPQAAMRIELSTWIPLRRRTR